MTRLLVSAIFAAALLQAQQPQPLWPNGAPGAQGTAEVDIPTLTSFPAPEATANGAAVVICPGGGYVNLAMDHEGVQVAKWFNDLGVSAYLLKYRLGPKYRHPIELGDAQRAIRTVRANAAAWKVDPNRIGILGFSAGGHLASTAGTHFDAGNPQAPDPIDRVSSRPDFLILGYPVVTMTSYTHQGSKNALLGPNPEPSLIQNLSNELQVTAQTPPTFLFHTTNDNTVPVENSVNFYLALRKAGVPAEMHLYERGRHGVGLAPTDPVLSTWPARLADWLKLRGILDKK